MTTISKAAISKSAGDRVARWVSLMALAGLLAMASLPGAPDASDDAASTLTTTPLEESTTWHG